MQLVRFQRQKHDVLRPQLRRPVARTKRPEYLDAVFPQQLYAAVPADGFEIGAPCDHRNVSSGLGDTRRNHPADRACTDDAYPHGRLSK